MNTSTEKHLKPYLSPAGAWALCDQMQKRNTGIELGKGVIIASGISDCDVENDKNFGCVFERADALMYENKKVLKGAGI